MKPESYLQQKVDSLVADIVAKAPSDICSACPDGNGQLIYDGHCFFYECSVCGERWAADCLEIDTGGYMSRLEWAD